MSGTIRDLPSQLDDDQLKPFVTDIFAVVEANSFERHTLWQRHAHQYSWEDNLSGIGYVIGTLDDRPIMLSLLTSTLGGKKILWIEPTSQVVDWKMIDEWRRFHLPKLRKWDAGNFHNVIRDLQQS